MAKNKQLKVFDESLEPKLVILADKCIEFHEEIKKLKENMKNADADLIKEMGKTGKFKFRHHARLFEVVNPDLKQKLKIKDAKPT